ncbi:MAG: Mut7-C RNAse domain-containing protein [Blastocatellia bacterium]
MIRVRRRPAAASNSRYSSSVRSTPPDVRELHEAFHICRDCRRLYWPGTHYQRMRGFVDAIIKALRASA